MPAILAPTPTHVNAQGLLREVHAAEEGLEAGVVTQRIKLSVSVQQGQCGRLYTPTGWRSRLAQNFVPLMSALQDAKARRDLAEIARQYRQALIADRRVDTEVQVLEVIRGQGPGRLQGC